MSLSPWSWSLAHRASLLEDREGQLLWSLGLGTEEAVGTADGTWVLQR